MKKLTDKELRSLILQMLMEAKTEEDLEAANDLADEAVAAGRMTQEEVDTLWDDFAPNLGE